MRGVDLATVTSPPFFLAPVSLVEVGSCWAERPSVFAAPAAEPSAEKRALLVLEWVLLSLKRQFYAGDVDGTGTIKKPLNAFLGELFVASWNDDDIGDGDSGLPIATTHLVVEQVSHHPPTTGVYIWDPKNGIKAQAFSRVKMVFNTGFGSEDATGLGIDVIQYGHGMLHIDKFQEDHLIPAPRARVKGLLSGRLYPELVGTCYVVSSSGFVSEIQFSPPDDTSRGDRRNRFKACMYRRDDPARRPLYTVSGKWNGFFSISDARSGEVIKTHDRTNTRPVPANALNIDDMDPWETRRAWCPVVKALHSGDMVEAAKQKSKLEKAQRVMRSIEERGGIEWSPLIFRRREERDERFQGLVSAVKWPSEEGEVVWVVDEEKAQSLRKPFRKNLTPFGYL
ncbi:uncharacterized protein BCR38DRAFT_403369 [Pseudomassariella vexata]|uniref:Oxysterol-binding protein n=1 Tax=Pseudomassariella vexata TaxID=1141098 RepID=A0A1Y2D823_9PEZI|nr:uncharacterized protein BCR38DRAFT_403369 [Pseudomassariella vexata]ORY55266.1 hypothetical protein BCR38DRAFT_403369 [Pseudomassariella vexata]